MADLSALVSNAQQQHSTENSKQIAAAHKAGTDLATKYLVEIDKLVDDIDAFKDDPKDTTTSAINARVGEFLDVVTGITGSHASQYERLNTTDTTSAPATPPAPHSVPSVPVAPAPVDDDQSMVPTTDPEPQHGLVAKLRRPRGAHQG